jgi:hypothetical protein
MEMKADLPGALEKYEASLVFVEDDGVLRKVEELRGRLRQSDEAEPNAESPAGAVQAGSPSPDATVEKPVQPDPLASYRRANPGRSVNVRHFAVQTVALAPNQIREGPRIAPGPVSIEVRSTLNENVIKSAVVRLGGRYGVTDGKGRLVIDGVPAGDYLLRVEAAGFDLFETMVTLSDGEREPQMLRLRPTVSHRLSGRILLDGHHEGVAGVRMELLPLEVPSFLQGRWVFSTDLDGRFALPPIPAGRYRVELRADGCLPQTHDIVVERDTNELQWSLAASSRALPTVAVDVRDAASQAPIDGAVVTLAEAWPRGTAAQSRTNPSGRAEVAGLLAGTMNWEIMHAGEPVSADAALRDTSRVAVNASSLMVRVEAAGYVTALAPCNPDGQSRITVLLHRVQTLDPGTGNTSVASAGQIQKDVPFRLSLSEQGIERWFRLRLDYPTHLRVQSEGALVMTTHLSVIDSRGNEVAKTWQYGGNLLNLSPVWLQAGDYLIKVTGGGVSDTPFVLKAWGPQILDIHAPNHSREQARAIQPGQQVRGYLHGPERPSFHRFTIRRPSELRLSLANSDRTRRITLIDSRGEELQHAWNYGSNPVSLQRMVDPGDYYVQVSSDGLSVSPYSLWLRVVEDDGIDDTGQGSGGITTPRELPHGSMQAANTFPSGDVDYFRIPVPGRGRLHLSAQGSVNCAVTLIGADGVELTRKWNYGGNGIAFHWDADGPVTWFAKVQATSTESSPQPYRISAFFEPCDELDHLLRNDETRNATPMQWEHPMRGSLFPSADADWYSIEVDHPGRMKVTCVAPVNHRIAIHNAQGDELATAWNYGGNPANIEAHVLPGLHRVRVTPNGNVQDSGQYVLTAQLVRAEPSESVPSNQDPLRVLSLNEAQTWRVDDPQDVDRFGISVMQAGKYHLFAVAPVNMKAKLINAQTGEVLVDAWQYGNNPITRAFELSGPTQLRLELQPHGVGWSSGAGHVLVSDRACTPSGATLEATIDPFDPTLVRFAFDANSRLAPPERVELDCAGNGLADVTLMPAQSATFRFPSEGLYRVDARMFGPENTVTRESIWVEARGPVERDGVILLVDRPSEGQVIDSDITAMVKAMSYTGAAISRIEAWVDGSLADTSYTTPHEFEIPWKILSGGEHSLRFVAVDGRGVSASVERRFRVSDYFDLMPADQATVTGNQVRVSWTSGSFTPTVVRYRPEGSNQWKEIVGESGQNHSVQLEAVDPEVVYEYQPIGGAEPGPVRRFTRVRGLAFGQQQYGPTIERDYDQRFPITVRNHADQAQWVKLEAGSPATDELLVGFVEEGAAERPFELGPGEERAFILSLNAQDAVTERFRFPIRIQSDSGYSDEAEVAVAVRLPKVELEWEDLGPTERGLGKRLRLWNRGDSLTDLTVTAGHPDLSVSPSIVHGLFPAGQKLELTIHPRLHDGFQSVTGPILASAVKDTVPHEVSLTVPDGQRVFLVNLFPDDEGIDPDDAERMRLRTMAAHTLTPMGIQLEDWGSGVDSTGDRRINRWVYDDTVERIRWTGEDTSGDGEIDFVNADVGFDGQINYASILRDGEWERTSIVDVWIETAFTHPRNRSSYDPYDVDIVLNGVTVGQLQQTLPEGNHRFRVPPTALRFNDLGIPADNQLEVRSRGMGRGSYGMSSDFQIRTRLTGMPIWTVAESREAAMETVRATPGLLIDKPDYSVASDELQLRLPEKQVVGEIATLVVPVRNLGVAEGETVGVALCRSEQSGGDVQVQRTYLEGVPVNGVTRVVFEWPLEAGNQRYRITVDPDEETRDSHRANNTGYIWVSTPGDDVLPEVEFQNVQSGMTLNDTVFELQISARDDARVARVEASVDGGTWTPLEWMRDDQYGTALLLQPGEREVAIRAFDPAGNQSESRATVRVDAPMPDVRILQPSTGAVIPARQTMLELQRGETVVAVAVRVNEGPWHTIRSKEPRIETEVPLRFGSNRIDVKAVNNRGAERMESITVQCTSQLEANAGNSGDGPAPAASGDSGSPSDVEVDGFGSRSVNADGSQIRHPRKGQPVLPPGYLPWLPAEPEAGVDEAEDPDGDMDAVPDLPQDAMELWQALENEQLKPQEWSASTGAYDGSFPYLEADDPYHEDIRPLEALYPLFRDVLFNYLQSVADQYDPAHYDDDGDAEDDTASPLPAESGLTFPPPPGRAIAVQHTQKTHHCTNRRNIAMPFSMPEWLKVLDLPTPGTDEYESEVVALITKLQMQGVTTGPLENFYRMLRNRAARVNSPDELPGYFQSLFGYFAPPAKTDEAALKAWREGMVAKVDTFWLRLLSSGDPDLIYQGLRSRADSFSQFDEAMSLAADAALQTVQANQKITMDVMQVLPVVGTFVDVCNLGSAAWYGESMSGEQMSVGDAGMMLGLRALMLGAPKAGGAIYNKLMQYPNGRLFVTAMSEMGGNMRSGTLRAIGGALGRSEDEVRQAFAWAGDHLTRQRSVRGGIDWALGRKTATAAKNFVPPFRSSLYNQRQSSITNQRLDVARAERFLDRMNRVSNPEQFRKMAVQLQRNKTAQALLNSDRYDDALRTSANRVRDRFGHITDRATIRDIQSMSASENGLDRILRKNRNLSAADVEVRARTITRTPTAGDPVRYGSDRDVWFEFVNKKTGQRLGDVHHSVSGSAYDRNLRRLTGYGAEDLDHTVTSWWHPDTYGTGVHNPVGHEAAARAIVDRRCAGQLNRVRDVADTTRYKPREFFRRAQEATNPIQRQREMREGVRQAVKEYERHVQPYLQHRGLGPDRLPPRLKHGMDIMRQVQDGVANQRMTPEMAEQMIRQLPGSQGFETIVDDLAGFIEFINIWGL